MDENVIRPEIINCIEYSNSKIIHGFGFFEYSELTMLAKKAKAKG